MNENYNTDIVNVYQKIFENAKLCVLIWEMKSPYKAKSKQIYWKKTGLSLFKQLKTVQDNFCLTDVLKQPLLYVIVLEF